MARGKREREHRAATQEKLSEITLYIDNTMTAPIHDIGELYWCGKWFYWSVQVRNDKGETLLECLHKYGTGGVVDHELAMLVVFLDESQTTSYSWLLALFVGQCQVPCRSYQERHDALVVHAPPPTTAFVRVCAGCLGFFEETKTCSNCMIVNYCSKHCQARHWKKCHKKECKKCE